MVAARPATRGGAERSAAAAAARIRRDDAHPPPVTRQAPSGASSIARSEQGRPQNGTRTRRAGMRRLYHRARAAVQSGASRGGAGQAPPALDTIGANVVP